MGTYDTDQEREENKINTSTISLWSHLKGQKEELTNIDYIRTHRILMPIASVKIFSLWKEFYLRYDEIYYRHRKRNVIPLNTMTFKKIGPVQEGDEEAPILMAFLWKLGGKVKNWRRRWFVLANSRLEYWKTEKTLGDCLGSVHVEGAEVCTFDDGALGR